MPRKRASENKPTYQRGRKPNRDKISDTQVIGTEKSKNPSASAKQFYADKELLWNPTKDHWRKKFAETLLAWAYDTEGVTLGEFLREHRIPRSTFDTWVQTHKDLHTAIADAKYILGDRRYRGALTKKFDASLVKWDQHLYDPDYDAVNKYHAKLSAKEEGSTKPVVVMIPRAMNTDIVTSEEKEKRLEEERVKKEEERSAEY